MLWLHPFHPKFQQTNKQTFFQSIVSIILNEQESVMISCVLGRDYHRDMNISYILPLLSIEQEISWFDVSVDNAKLVNVSQGFKQVEDVMPHILKTQRANNILQEMKTFW